MRIRPQARPRGPHVLLSGGWLRLLLAWALCQCALNLEDPAQEAKDKLAKVVPTSMELMVGRWLADSTFTADDIHATGLNSAITHLEFLADTTYLQMDSSGFAFPAKASEGLFYLHVDTLIIFPLASNPDTFVVHLRFLGNYLEMMRPSEQRFIYFHKVKPRATAFEDSLLGDSLWLARGHRVDPGIYRPEPLIHDFSYYRFRGDSLFADIRRDGVVSLDSGPLAKDGLHWTWTAAGGTREFIGDLVTGDSLRMWPLVDGRPDSGWFDYVRTQRYYSGDVDMRPLLGHLRADSLTRDEQALDYHYGRYWDWILGEDHKVTVQTNMTDVPLWKTWTLDSGYLSLSAPGSAPERMRVDTGGGKLTLVPDTGVYFGPRSTLSMTRIADRDYAARPLDRFESASWLEINLGADTAYYFFAVSYEQDRYMIKAGPGPNDFATAFILPKNLETYQSGQPDFYLAFTDSSKALGRFTCRSRPYRDLVIRQTVSPDPQMATGLIQGACEIVKADSAFADSSLSFEGSFKLRRRFQAGFDNPVWTVP